MEFLALEKKTQKTDFGGYEDGYKKLIPSHRKDQSRVLFLNDDLLMDDSSVLVPANHKDVLPLNKQSFTGN